MDLVINNDLYYKIMSAAIVDGGDTPPDGPLFGDNLLVGLYTNVVNVTANTVLADLTEPVGSWYTKISMVLWSEVYRDATGDYSLASPVLQFLADTVTEGETITGLYVINSVDTPDAVVAAGNFPEAIPIANDLDAINAVLSFKMGGGVISAAAELVGA